MDDKNPNPLENESSLETLEDPTIVVEPADTDSKPANSSTSDSSTQPGPQPNKPPRFRGLRSKLSSVNIYLLIFILVIVLTVGIGAMAYISSQKNSTATNVAISSQTLDAKALAQLANTDTTVGSSGQVLNVQSSAIFAGKVLVRDSLEVAGGLQIGGSLSLAGVSVSGSSSFGQVQVNKNLAVLGDTSMQGSLTVQKSLSVNGGGTFSGPLSASQISANTLQLNGDLNLTHHITAGGATPSRTNGPALGGGGTASVSGSDTSGSITINTGSGPGVGCFITINFAAKYNTTPHVIISPVGSDGASLAYYTNRSSTSFSVCTASTPPANANFGFDYFVLD